MKINPTPQHSSTSATLNIHGKTRHRRQPRESQALGPQVQRQPDHRRQQKPRQGGRRSKVLSRNSHENQKSEDRSQNTEGSTVPFCILTSVFCLLSELYLPIRCSSFRACSIENRAHGCASSRGLLIGSPVPSQMPYVPS